MIAFSILVMWMHSAYCIHQLMSIVGSVGQMTVIDTTIALFQMNFPNPSQNVIIYMKLVKSLLQITLLWQLLLKYNKYFWMFIIAARNSVLFKPSLQAKKSFHEWACNFEISLKITYPRWENLQRRQSWNIVIWIPFQKRAHKPKLPKSGQNRIYA